MTALLISGYRSFEVGIFQDKDPRLAVIKKAIRRDLIQYLEEGVDWLIFTGNLGFDYWVLEVAKELQEDYPIALATIFLFENQGENWTESNQAKLAAFKQVDFIKYSFPHYENPGQFVAYHQFLLENTQEAYFFYDAENETNFKHLYNRARAKEGYSVRCLDFERLNDIAQESTD
ncbi:DUF1273 domain-containing protein [Streptococcus sp. DD12]|uniref:DUF1273 domain-containing protein n=1 Tax=Streptococcus sp. DD12 TaxID=1777880 RepID=UPI000793E68E|nr:DUF1273 domain-containing protein [Streptococcus sp. DD12]KXT75271.1 hypothetical protein STRDD12_01537 [Streptococcus sp. DD12]